MKTQNNFSFLLDDFLCHIIPLGIFNFLVLIPEVVYELTLFLAIYKILAKKLLLDKLIV